MNEPWLTVGMYLVLASIAALGGFLFMWGVVWLAGAPVNPGVIASGTVTGVVISGIVLFLRRLHRR